MGSFKNKRTLSIIVFWVYMLLLIWLILFKFATDFNYLPYIRAINLIPLKESVSAGGRLNLKEIIYNILVFIPFGVYTDIFKPDRTFIKKASAGLFLSLLFESLQFIFAIGVSDITDIIGNTLGGIIGIAVCRLLKKLFKNKSVAIINIIGIIIEISAFAILGILLTANI